MKPSSLVLGALAVGISLVAILAPLISLEGFVWVVAIISAWVAYQGVRAPIVSLGLLLLIIFEAGYGFSVGVLSIAYLGAVSCLLILQRFFSLTPWSHQQGWSLGDGVRSVLVAWIFFIGVILGSVVVGALLYGTGAFWMRVQSLMEVRMLIVPLLIISGVTLLMRRMAIPFKRAILFGL